MDRFKEILQELTDVAHKAHIRYQESQNHSSQAGDSPETLEDYKSQFLGMTISSLRNVLTSVAEILNKTNDNRVKENLTQAWLQGMIAIIENNVNTVHDYVMFSDDDADTISEAATKNRPGLWENIRKKKEREGKKYKPAKTQKEGRPDPETWDRLTKQKPK